MKRKRQNRGDFKIGLKRLGVPVWRFGPENQDINRLAVQLCIK